MAKISASELNEIEYLQARYESTELRIDGRPVQKLFLAGRSEAGKTTLIQAMKGDIITYDKTQYINSWDLFIDTPGEYYESKYSKSSVALCVFSFESDVVACLAGADEPFSILGYGIPTAVNRPLIGIITKCDEPGANVEMARLWLENAGVYKIFEVDSITGRGVPELKEFLFRPKPEKISLEEAIARQQRGLPEWIGFEEE